MIIQLLVISVIFIGLAIWFFIKNRKPLGFTFLLIGLVAMIFFFIVRWLYPHTVPF